MNTLIDSRAIVSPKAEIGSNVRIGPNTIIEDNVIVADGTVIGANALIARGTRLGRDCQVHHGAVVGHVPQDLKYQDEPTTCEVGERTVIREYAVIHRGTAGHGKTVIGSDCLLMAYIHIAHDCEIGSHVIMSNAAMMAGHVMVEDWAIISGITPIHQFVRIGRHSFLGGGVRVSKDVPPYVLASNEPLVAEGLNSVGLRRRGFSRATIDALGRAYWILYHEGLNVSQALDRIRSDSGLIQVEEVRTFVEFIAASKRGIIPGPRLRS